MSQEAIEEEFLMLDSFYSSEQLVKDTVQQSGAITGGTFRARVQIPESGAVIMNVDNNKKHDLKFVPPLELNFQLPDGYPENCDPLFRLSCSWLRSSQLVDIGNQLRHMVTERPGEPVLWFWFEFLERELWDFLGLGSELKFDNWSSESEIKRGEGFSVLQLSRSASQIVQEIMAVDSDERLQEFRRSFHECSVCAASQPGHSCARFQPCGHVFCDSCVASAFRALLDAGRPDKLGCLQCSGDNGAVDPSLVQRLLKPEEFEKYQCQLFDITLSKMGNLDTCPRCQGAVLIDEKDNNNLGHCTGCYHAFCLLCRATYHGTNHCQIRGSSLENVLQAYMNGDGAKRHKMECRYGGARLRSLENDWRSQEYLSGQPKCPSCKTSIEKIDGCNKMTCFKCKTYFCWLCSATLDGQDPYKHYRSGGSSCVGKLFEGLEFEGAEVD